jgi:hypothetical protein
MVTESREFPSEPAAPAEAPQVAGTQVNGEQHSSNDSNGSSGVNARSEPIAAPAAEPSDLDTLLKEYDAQVQPSPIGQPAEQQPEPQQEPDELERLLADLDRQQQPQTAPADPLAAERDQLKQQLAEAQHRERVQRDLTDFEEVEAALDKDVREIFPDVPRGYVRMYMYAMASAAPDAVRIFDQRYQNPAAFRALYNNMSKELYRLMRERPDKEASEVRAMINHAVRGASTGNVEMKEPAPQFHKMSDRELRQWQEEHLGSSQI